MYHACIFRCVTMCLSTTLIENLYTTAGIIFISLLYAIFINTNTSFRRPCRHQNRKYLQDRLGQCLIWHHSCIFRCREVFQSSRHSLKSWCGHQNRVSTLFSAKRIVLPVSTSKCWILYHACILRCRVVFHSSRRHRKPRCGRRNRISALFSAKLISTSGFDVKMLLC